MNLDDTIMAVSTPAGAGERAVLRLSGPRAVEIAERVFAPGSAGGGGRNRGLMPAARSAEAPAPAAQAAEALAPAARSAPAPGGLAGAATCTVHAGRLAPPGTGLAVAALVYLMRAPRSYTRQDVVEFHIGSWPAVLPILTAGLVSAGARPAEPGEFTFRALVNGRLDLAQAEAVMEVVSASTEAALRAAGDLLSGHLSRQAAALIEAVRDVLVLVEADLDFSDQDLALAPAGEVAVRIEALRLALADLGRRSRGLETYSGDVRLVLAGWPNVGKSSLFNRLLEADRAIVSPVAGTTRDELRAALHLGDLRVLVSDVAGLDRVREELAAEGGGPTPAEGGGPTPAEDGGPAPRPTNPGVRATFSPVGAARDGVARQARAKALEAIGRADLVLLVLDATAPSYERTADLLGLLAAPMVVAVSKCDLAPADRARAWLAARGVAAEAVATSAATGEGVAALRAALGRAVEGGTVDRQAAGPVVTARHRAALERAAVALARGGRVAKRGSAAGELVALELREALEALGTVAGRTADASILEAVFARFCIGK